jgi:hypothetical protein
MSAWPAGLLLLIPSLVLSQTPAKYVGTISVGHRVIDQFAFPYPNCECGIAPDDAPPNYQLGAVTTRHSSLTKRGDNAKWRRVYPNLRRIKHLPGRYNYNAARNPNGFQSGFEADY